MDASCALSHRSPSSGEGTRVTVSENRKNHVISGRQHITLSSFDARAKIVVFLLIGTFTFSLSSPGGLVPGAILAFLGMSVSDLKIWELIKRMRFVAWFVVVIIISNALTRGGAVALEFRGMIATWDGIAKGLLLSARIVLVFWLSILLVLSTTVPEMIDAAESSLQPFRRRFGFLLVIVNLTITMGPMLVRAAQRIKTAQIAKGADVGGGMFSQIRFAVSAAVPLFANSFRMADQLATAMDSRCYDPVFLRTPFADHRLNQNDGILVFASVGLMLVVGLVLIAST